MLKGLRAPACGRSSRRVWGDPFADDGCRDVARVVDWASIDESELFRFMPGLRRTTSGVRPRPIRSAFERCVDRPEQASGAPGRPTASLGLNGSEDHRDGVAVVRRVGRRPVEATAQFSERDARRVALVSSVHPAFVWPEALVSHDRFATFAWLGCLGRARRALVPPEVAGYIVETVEVDGRRVTVRDTAMGRLLRSDAVARALLSAARKRLTRASVVFDIDSLAIRAASALSAWRWTGGQLQG